MHLTLGYYAVWPAMVCIVLLTGLVSTPLFNVLDSPPAAHPKYHRVRPIDGLRGYLALAVVFHHIAILRLYLLSGTNLSDAWRPPPSRFFAMVGPAAVSMFFMITAYLFWSRVLKRKAGLDWREFYVGRIFRIGPLYLVAVGLAVLLDHVSSTAYAMRTTEAATSFTKQVASLFFLGLSVYPDKNKLLAGVTWSIQYEWLFYLGLPLLALLCLAPRLQVSLLVAALVACLSLRAIHRNVIPGTRTLPIIVALFLTGMVCATLQAKNFELEVPDWAKSVLTIALLAGVFAFRDAYTAGPVLLLGAAFFLISSGCTLFGLLTSRGAIRLGDVSYGIYLLQGLAFAFCLRPVPLREIFLRSPAHFWLMTLATLVALLLFATLTYALIERNGINAGRRIARRLDRALGSGTSAA